MSVRNIIGESENRGLPISALLETRAVVTVPVRWAKSEDGNSFVLQAVNAEGQWEEVPLFIP